ncbi:F-box only protein 36 isoform X2 [Phyllostomus discolor]|uniref:F-box only protein 36 isoform X2 n=1 Tax=Phyllostomus discolor TaxID=89673 RepID=A0A7E6DI28_9CHIR|nr:F-box only protein 36 isoform X2 [Phyllostomus discolor]
MASWLPETLFEIVGQGPAPSKDYYQLLVTRTQVIFRWWKVSLRSEYRSSEPGETKESHEDFLENSPLQGHLALDSAPASLARVVLAGPPHLCKSKSWSSGVSSCVSCLPLLAGRLHQGSGFECHPSRETIPLFPACASLKLHTQGLTELPP